MTTLYSFFSSNFFLSTLIPVLIGGLASFIGGYISARLAARAQILSSAQASFVQVKLNAFCAFETALKNWSITKSREALGEVYQQGNSVYLVSNDKTAEYTHDLLELFRKYENQGQAPGFYEIAPIRQKLIKSMRRDLLTYPIPKPIKESLIKESLRKIIVNVIAKITTCIKHNKNQK